MNAGAMVTQAKQWTTVPSQQACTTSTITMSMYVSKKTTVEQSLAVTLVESVDNFEPEVDL
jgi:hypothetical protein